MRVQIARSRSALRRAALFATVATTCLVAFAAPANATAGTHPNGDWPMFGQNLGNDAGGSASIDTRNAGTLQPRWVLTTGGTGPDLSVSARAAVVRDVAYFPNWGGQLYAVDTHRGTPVWSKDIAADYFGGAMGSLVVSRTSPFVDGETNTVYVGTQSGAYLLAIDSRSGALIWKTQLDPHPQAIDTSSPVADHGVIYVGVSSNEENAAVDPNYPCCSFRGSVVALSATTGAILWKTPTVPDGYSGGAVWSSTIVPDPVRHVVYATTGNNYALPLAPQYQACIARPGATQASCLAAYNAANGTSFTTVPLEAAYQACISGGGTETACLSPADHLDSILALSAASGSIVWSQRLASADDWNVACVASTPQNCPNPAGPDFDFGSGVNMLTIPSPGGGHRTIVGAGQKSGVYSAFDPDNGGRLLWATVVGPGRTLGGIEWGSATDGQRIYVAISDISGIPYTLQPSGVTATAGSWGALDPATGQILWQTADPNVAGDVGPVAVANGVVYAPSIFKSGPNMFALNAATGAILWSFASGGSVVAGAVVVDDTVYWGSGYGVFHTARWASNDKFYAFTPTGAP
jgi:polyvinyl alcohol dehydrogenase (cytochrome)